MAGPHSKKRKVEEGMRGRTSRAPKKFKKQRHYHSSSSEDEDEDFTAVNLQDSDDETPGAIVAAASDDDEPNLEDASSDSEVTNGEEEEEEEDDDEQDNAADDDDDDDNDNDDDDDGPADHHKKKRNDPDAFATSMSKILSAKLSTAKRQDPVLARSAAAAQASKDMAEHALEQKARNKLKEEKKALLEKGRVRDVLGASTAFDAAHVGLTAVPSVAETMALEKKLRKTAQRGVVKLFNAFRAAQVKAQQAERDARRQGFVGQAAREEKVTEMSKQGFLDLIAGGGHAMKAAAIEEA